MPDDILAGVRVLDFTTIVSGPYCTRMLADLGAEVLKVEPPEGDYIRTQPPMRDGHSAYFAHLNCGKKSMAIDLKRPGAAEVMRELADRCDVVVENSRPGVMRRLGLDYERLSSRNPRIIYCSISGFGQSGPWAGRSAYAPILHAASGYDVTNLSYQSGLTAPLTTGIYVGDVLGGTCAFGAIQAALYHRERTGRGENIDLAMMDAMLGMLIYEFQEAQFPVGRTARGFPPTRTSDGFVMIAFVKPNNFEATAHAIGHPEWISDPRFSTIHNRMKHWDELMVLIGEWASSRTSAECEATLDQAGVPCSRYYSVRDAQSLEHLAERASFETIDDGAGPLRVPNPAFKFAQSAARARGYVPALGADTVEILSTVLGYPEERIDKLRGQSVVVARD
jgi:CoA:oxalate CoA-transferase